MAEPKILKPGLVAGLQAGAQAGSSLIGLIGQRAQNKANKRLAEYSYKMDLAQWNRENEYNTPAQQMARLKAAGLNPNLVYGSGQAVTESASSPSFNAPEYKLDTGNLVPEPMPVLGAYQDVMMKRAQIDNVNSQTLNNQTENTNKLLEQEILKKNAERLGIDLEQLRNLNPLIVQKLEEDINAVRSSIPRTQVSTETAQFDLSQKKVLAPYNAEIAKQSAQQAITQSYQALKDLKLTDKKIEEISLAIQGKATANEIAQQDLLFKQYENLWKANGVTSSDSYLVRVANTALRKLGIGIDSATDFIKRLVSDAKNYDGTLNFPPWRKK